MNRDILEKFLNNYLNVYSIADKSVNGLQVEGSFKIKKIVLSVSYSISVAQETIKNGADTIIVHHGILWNEVEPITSVFKKRIEILIKNNVNLFAYHLPLDLHPKIGNNVSIIKLFNVYKIKPFGFYKGKAIGFKAKLLHKTPLNKVIETIKEKINPKPFVLDFGKKEIESLAVISGRASSFLVDAIKEKIDLYITGEPAEEVFELSRDLNMNFIAAGHYKTEVFGIKNLQKILEKKFKIQTLFFDTENPL